MGEIKKGQVYFCQDTCISIYIHDVDIMHLLISFNDFNNERHLKKLEGYLEYLFLLGFELVD